MCIQNLSVTLWATGYILKLGVKFFYEKIVTCKRVESLFGNEKRLFWPADAVFIVSVPEITYVSRCAPDCMRLFPAVACA